jgi:hypothetical protein
MTINGTDSNQDPFSRVYFKSASINDVDLTEAQLTSHGFVINGNSLMENYQSAQRTGTYNVNVYALDPIEVNTRIDSSFTYTITNAPPVFEKLTATFINNASQTCNPGDQCLIPIDNGEAAKITVRGTDPDSHNLNYSLVDNFSGKLSINAVSGTITGLENINFKQLNDQTISISVKIADSYCNNSTIAECSVIYSFDLLVEKYCSIDMPESTTKLDIAGPININQSGQRLETGITLNDCSSVGTSTADVKLIGESHSQAIVLISDLSGSMNTNVVSNGTTERAVNRLKKALTTANTGLFDRIYELADKLSDGYFTKLGLVAFNSTVVSSLDLSDISLPGSLATLKNTVNLYSAYAGTNTLLGLNKADEMLTKITDPKVEKIVILMSDGIPAVDGRKDVYYCSKKDPSCYCGGTAGNCNTPPSCGSGGTYNQAPDGNSCVCFCYCGTAADGKCNPTPSCAYNEYTSVNWGVSCSCVAGACDDKCASGSYPNCNYPNCLCGYDENTCQCLPDTCQSVFNIFFKKTLGFFDIFKTKLALAETAQTQCISTCSKPDSCASDEVQGCYASGITPNCDITTDVDAEATALKNSKVSIYTIYYNTSNTAAPKQKMCNWSSNNGTSCDNNTFSFAGTDIDTMISKVLARIITKPKDVLVNSSVIIDNGSTEITSSVLGADITGLTCGLVRPIVTYTNDGYLEFTNIKLNYCEAKLHS